MQRLHLLAHSMGNYVLRWALQSFGRDHPSPLGMPRVFQNIFLMSADEDDDAFDTPLKFGRLHELLSASPEQPTFTLAFSVSNHSPWEYPEGRITPGCAGLWTDAQAEAFAPSNRFLW